MVAIESLFLLSEEGPSRQCSSAFSVYTAHLAFGFFQKVRTRILLQEITLRTRNGCPRQWILCQLDQCVCSLVLPMGGLHGDPGTHSHSVSSSGHPRVRDVRVMVTSRTDFPALGCASDSLVEQEDSIGAWIGILRSWSPFTLYLFLDQKMTCFTPF